MAVVAVVTTYRVLMLYMVKQAYVICCEESQRVGQLKLTYSPCSAKHIKGAEDQFPEDHNGARKTNRTALGNNFHRQNSYFICKGTDDF